MIKPLLFGLTLGSVGTLVAMQYHLVRTEERLLIVARAHQPPLRSTYVDIRHWSPAMWQYYPELQEAIVKAGRSDLMVSQTESTAATENAIPFQGVSGAGQTPIFTASEARKTETPPENVLAPATMGPTAFRLPQIALGAANSLRETVNTTNPSAANPPTPLPATSPAAEQHESPLPAEQRTVPQPDQIVPSPLATRITNSTSSPSGTPQGKWMQSLLRSIVPGAGESPAGSVNAANPSPVSSAPATIPPEEKGSLPEIPASTLPNAKPVLPTEESTFPATPRRIFTTGLRGI